AAALVRRVAGRAALERSLAILGAGIVEQTLDLFEVQASGSSGLPSLLGRGNINWQRVAGLLRLVAHLDVDERGRPEDEQKCREHSPGDLVKLPGIHRLPSPLARSLFVSAITRVVIGGRL